MGYVINKPTLGDATLPYPSGISQRRLENSAEQTTLGGATRKDIMSYKYEYTLTYDYMSVTYFNNLLTELDKLSPLLFTYGKFPHCANGVWVLPSINERSVKQTPSGTGDSAYYSSVTITLKEVYGRIVTTRGYTVGAVARIA